MNQRSKKQLMFLQVFVDWTHGYIIHVANDYMLIFNNVIIIFTEMYSLKHYHIDLESFKMRMFYKLQYTYQLNSLREVYFNCVITLLLYSLFTLSWYCVSPSTMYLYQISVTHVDKCNTCWSKEEPVKRSVKKSNIFLWLPDHVSN